jgi:hypothetical protein
MQIAKLLKFLRHQFLKVYKLLSERAIMVRLFFVKSFKNNSFSTIYNYIYRRNIIINWKTRIANIYPCIDYFDS